MASSKEKDESPSGLDAQGPQSEDKAEQSAVNEILDVHNNISYTGLHIHFPNIYPDIRDRGAVRATADGDAKIKPKDSPVPITSTDEAKPRDDEPPALSGMTAENVIQSSIPLPSVTYDQTEVRKLQRFVKHLGLRRDFGLQTTPPITFDSECQTTDQLTRDRAIQSEISFYDIEVQTEQANTRQMSCQTKPLVHIDTQTPLSKQTDEVGRATYSEAAQQTVSPESRDFGSQTPLIDVGDPMEVPHRILKNAYQSEGRSISLHLQRYQKYKFFRPLVTHHWNKIRNKSIVSAIEKSPSVTQPMTHEDLTLVEYLEISKPLLFVEADVELLAKYIPHIGDAVACGRELAKSKYLHAIIMFYSICKLHKLANKGDESARGIKSCVYDIRVTVESMAKDGRMRQIILEYMIPVLEEMVEDMHEVPDTSAKIVSEQEAWCLMRIAGCYDFCGDNRNYLLKLETVIELMEKQFGEEAVNYEVYAFSLHNAGFAYQKIGDIERAIAKYQLALATKQKASWPSEDEKSKSIALTQRNLDKLLLIRKK